MGFGKGMRWKYMVQVRRDGRLADAEASREATKDEGGVAEEIWVEWMVVRTSKAGCHRRHRRRGKVVYVVEQQGMTW